MRALVLILRLLLHRCFRTGGRTRRYCEDFRSSHARGDHRANEPHCCFWRHRLTAARFADGFARQCPWPLAAASLDENRRGYLHLSLTRREKRATDDPALR
jgi:hypothetical protein